jgi:chorismate synthase
MLGKLRFLTAGESHGPGLTVILEGMPAGLSLDEEAINQELRRRQRGFGSGGRMKIEKDRAEILGGVMGGKTTGAPISVLIRNRDWENWRDRDIEPFTIPRPGHADLVGAVKYGYRELRLSLERASARETAARVAAGAIAKAFLSSFGITVGGYVIAIGGIKAHVPPEMPYSERFLRAEASPVRCPDEEASIAMQARIRSIMEQKDTLGGIIETVALGVPVGLGSFVHWDRRLDARISAAMMSIPAIKGVEIGDGFANADLPGSQAHDEIFLSEEGFLFRKTNRAGGIEGGVSNGMPIVVRAAMKPIATILRQLRSVDLAVGEPALTVYERSDFCPVPSNGLKGSLNNLVLI